MRKFFKVLCVASLLCLVANASEGLDKIGMTYVKSPLNVPSIVDKFKGFYAKSFGVPVEYSEITSGAKQTQALASNSLQFLNCVGGTSVILAAANKADIKIISAYSRAPEAFVIFSKDQNIKSPKDLKGKKVAGPKGTILNELLVRYLALGGLSINDVEFISMGIPAAQAAVENGSVDAALLAGPAAYNAQKSGLNVVTTGKGVITPVIVTATSGEFYKKHKDVVEKFK
ncbi:MAG: ABC transporter substrate-binding protein, partial [Campylobacter sp.]|nr:ABC transporter substrate-binding protein [Campylobacter sp.]